MSDRIDKLKDAIETMYRCKAVHFASEAVIELFRGEVAWDGVVETFILTGHPKAKRCHAWSYEEKGETQFVTVLELPPVDSAEMAVKVAIGQRPDNEGALYHLHRRGHVFSRIGTSIPTCRRTSAARDARDGPLLTILSARAGSNCSRSVGFLSATLDVASRRLNSN